MVRFLAPVEKIAATPERRQGPVHGERTGRVEIGAFGEGSGPAAGVAERRDHA
jgi:hypothetical protein